MYKSDLGRSPFFLDIFYWDKFKKEKGDGIGHYFRLKRIDTLLDRHETLLIKWMCFDEKEQI